MPRPRLVPFTIARIGRPTRVVAAAGGAALIGLPLIGAITSRFWDRDDEAEASAPLGLGLGLGLGAATLQGMLADPAAAETEQATRTARSEVAATGSGASGMDFGAGPGSWSLDGVPDLLGLGGKAVSAGVDGAGELAKIAGHGVCGLVGVAEAVGGAIPDLGDVADVAGAVGDVVGAVLGAIGDGLGDLNL